MNKALGIEQFYRTVQYSGPCLMPEGLILSGFLVFTFPIFIIICINKMCNQVPIKGNKLVLNSVSILFSFTFLGIIQLLESVWRLVCQCAMGSLSIVEDDVMLMRSRYCRSDLYWVRQISSSFIEAKNHSATELSWGWPDLENDWTTLFIRSNLRNTLEVYCAPWSL